jgi:hypothetical protein
MNRNKPGKKDPERFDEQARLSGEFCPREPGARQPRPERPRNAARLPALLAAVCLSGATASAVQPINDDFANRIPLSGVRVTVTAINIDATREPGEPDGPAWQQPGISRTIWWSWTAPADGVLAVSALGSDFNAVLDVHAGVALGDLVSVSDCPSGSRCPTARAQVVAGAAYSIVVGSRYGEAGTILLNLAFQGRPLNDNFASRIHLGSDNASAASSNSAATFESGEPGPSFPVAGRTVWWSWTAPLTEPVTVSVEGSLLSPEDKMFAASPSVRVGLTIFTGTELLTLTLVTNRSGDGSQAAAWAQVTFGAVAGIPYAMAVDGDVGFFRPLKLNIARTRPPLVILTSPANDAVFHADDIVAATAEATDPDGTVSGVEFSLLRRYGGEPGSTNVAGRPFRATWTGLSPGTYSLGARATDNLGARADAIPITFDVRPANDDFAHRTPFTGSFVTVTGILNNASSEPGDPLGNSGDIWWSWTAPASGVFTITVSNSPGYYPEFAVFNGASLGNLALVASSRYDGLDPSYSTRVVITAQAGVSYPIAVGSYGGVCTLTIRRSAPPSVSLTSPANDSTFLAGQPVTFSAAAEDADGIIRQVEFILDDYLSLGIATNRPFTLTTPFTTGNFRHRVRAWATDDAGVATRSEQVWFEIRVVNPGLANDNFADRIAFTGSFVSVTGSTAYATSEPGEPLESRFGSAWWAWTAPETGPFTITVRSQFGYWPSLAVFAGSMLADLQLLASDSFRGGDRTYSTRVVVNAQAGVTYPIAAGSGGQVTLIVAKTLPPSVTFASPTNGAVFVIGDAIELLAEATDPDGTVQAVEFYHNNGSRSLGVVTNRPFVLHLTTTNLFVGYDWIQAIATDDKGVSTVSAEVRLLIRPPGPVNDNFADRIPFTGSYATVTGTTANATFEGNEMSVPDGSAWWAWTAPESGDFTIRVASLEEGYWPAIAVFTGLTLETLNRVTNNAFRGDDPTYSTHVVVHAEAGTTYPIAVGSRSEIRLSVAQSLPPSVVITSPTNGAVVIIGETTILSADATDPEGAVSQVEFYHSNGARSLGVVTHSPFFLQLAATNLFEGYNWIQAIVTDDHGLSGASSSVQIVVQHPPPPNDRFAARLPLSGTLVSTEGSTRNATLEPGEPAFLGAGSVWWSWLAPASGRVTLIGAQYGSAVSVFTGSDLSNLTLIATGRASGSIAQLAFNAVAGSEYQIAISPGTGGFESVQLSLFLDARELRSPRMLASGLFSFKLRTTVERTWIIEASTNLMHWIPVAAGRCHDGELEFLDPNAGEFSRRFYRAVGVP